MAAPVIASSAATAGSNALAVPSGVVSGSLVIARIFGGWFTSTAPTSAAISAPAGWTFGYGQAFHDTPDGAYGYVAYFYKYATGADSGTYAFTVNSVGGASALATFGGVTARITGGPTSGNPFVDALETSGTSTSSPGPWSVASFTPGGDNTLLLGGQFCFSTGSGTLTGPSGWTGVATAASNGFGLFSLAQTTAAATGSLSFGAMTDEGWADVASIRAASSNNTGTAAVTLGTPTVAASSSNSGSAAVTLGRPTASVTGSETISGSAAATLGSPTVAVTGSSVNAGTVAATLGRPTVAVSSSSVDAGTAAATLGRPTASATGVLYDIGSVAATLGAPAVSAVGTETNPGSAAATLSRPQVLVSSAITGTVSAVLSAPTVTTRTPPKGPFSIMGADGSSYAAETGTGGSVTPELAPVATLPRPSVSAVGSMTIAGTVNIVLSLQTAAADKILGTAAIVLGTPVVRQGPIGPVSFYDASGHFLIPKDAAGDIL